MIQKPREHDRDGYRINEAVIAPEVRVIDQEGQPLGVLKRQDALRQAQEANLDLVEIAPQSSPPVCKLMNYGKFKYENQKKKAEAKKRHKVIETKEVKLTPSIGEHDYQVKRTHMQRFLEEGHKVKVTLRFRGREITHQELGLQLLGRVREDLKTIAKVDHMPQLEGKLMMMVLSALK